jgi:hypothetical protein
VTFVMRGNGRERERRPALSLARVAEGINASLRLLVIAVQSASSRAGRSPTTAPANGRDLDEGVEWLVDVTVALGAARRRCEELEAQILVAKAFLAASEADAQASDPAAPWSERTIGISPDRGVERPRPPLPRLESAS